jgi:hypothetical protein
MISLYKIHAWGREGLSLEAAFMRVWRYTLRMTSSEFEDALGGRDRATLEMNLEAVIVPVWRYTWRPSWCELGGRNRVRLEIRLDAVIERDSRCTWRTWLCKNGGVLRGSQSWAGWSGGRRAGSWDSIHWLTCYCGNVEGWVQHGLQWEERLVGSRRQLIMGWRSTQCTRYSVYAVLCVYCSLCMPYSVLTLDYGMER